MTIKSPLSSSTVAPKAATTGGVASYSYRALQAQNDIYLSTPTSTSHSNNDTLNTTTPHLQYHHRVLPTVTHKTVKRKDQTAGELQHRLATTHQRLATNKRTTTTNKKTTKTTTSQQSIEAELCKTLQISWIDARDLASFARGKLNIIPGDKSQEKTRRQSILRVAIEADKAAPRKRVLSKPKKKTKLTKEEETIQRLKKAENNALIRWDLRESRWGGRRHFGTYIY